MQTKIQIFIFLIFLSCSPNEDNSLQKTDQTRINNSYKTNAHSHTEKALKVNKIQLEKYQSILNPWLLYYDKYQIQLADFKLVNQNKLPNLTAQIEDFNLENDIYAQFYKPSPDQSKLLDLSSYNIILEINEQNELISYGSDVDMEISLKDLKDYSWRRLLFVGTPHVIEDGFWINDQQIFIVGQSFAPDSNHIKPTMWFVDLGKDIIQYYTYQTHISDMTCDYLEEVFYAKIKINNTK